MPAEIQSPLSGGASDKLRKALRGVTMGHLPPWRSGAEASLAAPPLHPGPVCWGVGAVLKVWAGL